MLPITLSQQHHGLINTSLEASIPLRGQHCNDGHKDTYTSKCGSGGVGLPTFFFKWIPMWGPVFKAKALYVLPVLSTVVGTQQALEHRRT